MNTLTKWKKRPKKDITTKNIRKKEDNRVYSSKDFEDTKLNRMRRRDCSKGLESPKRVLTSDEVDNKFVQDKGSNIQIVGSDVEALYPSLRAQEVAEIVYKAVLETKIKFHGVNWMEACKYIALTSTAQECRIGPLRRVLPRRRCVPGSRPGITGEDPMSKDMGDQEQWSFPAPGN